MLVFRLSLAAILLLVGCAGSGVSKYLYLKPAHYLRIPMEWTKCPKAPSSPPFPSKPRTTEDIAAWANQLDRALSQAQAARDECAGKLHNLVSWIMDNQE